MKRIDFHAHILPQADHGSDSVDTSLFQLEAAAMAKVDTIVATPHFYPAHHRAADFIARRACAFGQLMQAYRGDIRILPAAEVLLCEGLAHLPELHQLCIPGTNTLLIEMPMMPWSRRHIDTLADLRDKADVTIVLAHVDRYPPRQVEELLSQDFRAQLNAASLCRFVGRKRLLDWVRADHVVALGSDIHGEGNAYSAFSRACAVLDEQLAPLMLRTERLLAPESFT